ncbi:D-alanine--D-alanine ligase [Desulfuromonas acetoxidans]|uniref:D-alanine--D-alanine ligase n=1 Tax=Desulfuromonas acetoxidans (strain DSM 684 / 11070) TaxID=281689 RepID=Q1JXB8_DESA6|nr:D-alanine--D-alanine ligase [Desulfuromonas acetoxidans]EAT14874.1 D-alanine--D-alanine ligase [Desulfuromonas acetoxidans DSM 684]MBF0646842.1 D-alanine--D-alanine ligase [Desulfuromonas acetoxidans]NVD23334.1 D-alanine--D-alanine ligase [Desulfuromonas acetoxidans]NVE15425.1 D-alanine--D-alanine ligase [Desulfuromonas acetoxidans]
MKNKQQRIGVIMGGTSAEREVSLRTGAAIVKALEECGYTVVAIDADKTLPAQLIEKQIDVVFLAVHGRFGEDGTIQGMLELMQIPYTGSGVLASALAIDKAVTKRMVAQDGVTTPAATLVDVNSDVDDIVAQCGHFPQVVKPVREGSTLGIAIANNADELKQAIAQARDYDRRVLVEDYIDGREVTVSVMNGRALSIIEIVPESGFYDYTAKYTVGKTRYLVPAPLPESQYKAIQQAAVASYASLGCRGAARVDFMVTDDNFYFLEVNTIPGMTETSLLPKAAADCGMDFAKLVEGILDDASLDR